MTREETVKLLMTIRAIYPNFNVSREEMTPVTNAWHMMLEEYPADKISAALKIYVKTNNSGFAPSVSQLISSMYEPRKMAALSEGEAWAMVKRAIQDGNYHSEERFNELPEEVQRAVGDPNMIRQWALVSSEEINTVVMSNFQRNYRTVLTKREFGEKVPEAISSIVLEIAEKITPKQIGEGV